MGQTTITQIPAAVQTFYDKILLVRALPEQVHDLFGQVRSIKMNSGNQIKFRRYNSLTVATAELTEGVTPTPVAQTKTDITATLAQYGNLVQVTDMVEWTNQDPVITETATLLGENAGQSLDIVYRDVLAAGTSVRLAAGVAARTNVDSIFAATDLDIIIRALEKNNAKHFTKMVLAENRYGSSPIRAAYWGILHPDTHYDAQNSVTDWIPVHEYSSQQETKAQEIGSYKNIRFVMSTQSKIFADSGAAVGSGFNSTSAVLNDVYATLIFAKNAYGIVPLSGKSLEMISKPRGSGTDYLDQYSTHGWKSTTTITILDDTFMYRYEHTTTA
jgi:N4-gp56 family major capsid protein